MTLKAVQNKCIDMKVSTLISKIRIFLRKKKKKQDPEGREIEKGRANKKKCYVCSGWKPKALWARFV